MIKKLLFWLLLVIVLVSLNWFTRIVAQDLTGLSEEDEARLVTQLRRHQNAASDGNLYKSQEIFSTEGQPVAQAPVEHRQLWPQEEIDGKLKSLPGAPVSSRKMVTFEKLKPFGIELFRGPREIEPPTAIASASDYILGPGDNVIIYLWGRVEKEFNLTFDREGKVFIPKVGELIGWGLTLDQFKEKARRKFSKVYSEFDITTSLGKIRSIRIYVTGEVLNPGAYTVSSLMSLFNAIYLAGGPNERGSMRNIRLSRRGKLDIYIDLYEFLLEGVNSADERLETGDVVFVPIAGPRVAIRGEVKRPAIYELKGRQIAPEILRLAGNPTPSAHLDRVMLERISPEREWTVLDLNLNYDRPESIDSLVLADGDRVTVYSIFDFKKNQVGIFGKVKHPGYYERNDSTRISDLIRRGQLQPYDVYYGRADLFRRFADWRTKVLAIDLNKALAGNPEHDILLNDLDSLCVRSIDEVQWDRWVYIEGEIKKPGRYRLYKDMTAADLIFLAGTFKREASLHQGEIARLDSLGEVSLMYVPLDDSSADEITLREDDHLYVRPIPEWQQNPTVTLDGEVMYPGEYMLSSRNETIFQLIKRSGGFTSNAFPSGIVLERPSIQENLERLQIKRLIENSHPIQQDSLGNMVKQHVYDYDASQLDRLIVDIDRILATDGAEADVTLEPNDRIFVPSVPSGVSVVGAVGANGTIKFEERQKTKHFIKLAGGFTRRADKSETKLIRANGEIISGKKALGTRVKLGDFVIVPSKIEKDRNWFKTITAAVTATTGVLTSVYIISKL
jgi:protein involved in polysaccharide export with SLBB domain